MENKGNIDCQVDLKTAMAELSQSAIKLLPHYDIDKIKSYSVYVWDKKLDANVFDITANEIIYYDEKYEIIEEVLFIIEEIQEKLKIIQKIKKKTDTQFNNNNFNVNREKFRHDKKNDDETQKEYDYYINAGYPAAKNIYTVTGGTGYIGSKLLSYLSEQEDTQIYAIIRENSNPKVFKENIVYVTYDGTEASIEDVIYFSDYLVHLGALYSTTMDERTTEDLIMSNIMFSMKLFNVASKINPEIIISSASTFSALNSHGEYKPASLYAATKKAVEDIAHAYDNLSINFLTLPDTYGPNDWRPKIHNILMKNAEWPFQFRSSANQEMRLMHVEDVIGFIMESLENKNKGVSYYDIYQSGTLVTLKELSEIITDKECLFMESTPLNRMPLGAREFAEDTVYEVKYKNIEF